MIFQLILALGDGITFLFPFWYFGSKERHTQKAVFLIAVYSILNAYISMSDLSSEVIRESLLIAISILLIWTYIGHLNADILFLFICEFAVSDICILAGYFINYLFSYGIDFKVLSIAVQIIRFIAIYYLFKYIDNRFEHLWKGSFKDYALLLIPNVLLFEVIYQRYFLNTDQQMILELIASILSLLGAGYLIDRIHIKSIEVEQDNLVNREIMLSAKQIKNDDEKQREVRKIRHDIISELVTIQSLYHSGDSEEADTCIQNIVGRLRNTEIIQYCEYEYLNNLVGYKQSTFPTVKFDVKMSFDEKLNIDPLDLSVIVSNLIENAGREITENCPSDNTMKLRIVLNTKKLVIIAENSLSVEKGLQTSKADKQNHGFGLEIIRDIVNKYNGTMSINQNNKFTVSIIMFLQ